MLLRTPSIYVSRRVGALKRQDLCTSQIFESLGFPRGWLVMRPCRFLVRCCRHAFADKGVGPIVEGSRCRFGELYPPQVGDWTQELFRLGLEQPRLPLWITAAQPSIMEKSIYFDNGRRGRVNLTASTRQRVVSCCCSGQYSFN